MLDAMHHEFMPVHGLRMTGRHHEIYLSDTAAPTREAPDDPASAGRGCGVVSGRYAIGIAAVRPSAKRAAARSWLRTTGTRSVAFGRPMGFVET